jgi:hypothetical protein
MTPYKNVPALHPKNLHDESTRKRGGCATLTDAVSLLSPTMTASTAAIGGMNDDACAALNMQKRRAASNRDGSLPLTSGDTKGTRRIRRKAGGSCRPSFLAASVVFIVVALALFVGKSFSGTYSDEIEVGELPLVEFETVNNALDNANLVALYFAASWCPMSTPITEMLEEYYSSVPNLLYSSGESIQKKELAIVHVSSDISQSAMESYLRPGWIAVPFDSEERTALKKHFSVCAKRELQELGIERKFEIPSLIILDAETHGIITTSGVQDLKEDGAKALDRWIHLQSTIRGLESKYIKTI